MIIKFTNLGSIKETELNLRPLTIIIGPNNSNKTYIAYSIYGLWQAGREFEVLNRANIHLKKEGENSASIKIDEKFTQSFIKHYEKVARDFKGNLETFFQDSSGHLFSKTEFKFKITSDDVKEAVRKVAVKKRLTSFLEGNSLEVSLQNDILYVSSTSINGNEKSENIDRFFIELAMNVEMDQVIFSRPFLLPAERNAFILTYKLLANRRYKFLKQSRREILGSGGNKERQIELFKEQGDIGYPQPIEDFWDFLTDIELQPNTTISLKNRTVYHRLADDIERNIQNNNRIDLKSTKLGGKEIRLTVKRGLSIDLYNASSSIKQLAPLLLYLRYRAAENDLLIIDEPEMNLHPESQVKLLEVLAILVNLGVNVLLTTHSPYFMAHLNNLVIGNTKNQRALKSQASQLYLKDERAFLPKEKVSAYEMKDHSLQLLMDEDYGIRWDTLSDVSADLQQKFFQIYDKGKPSPRVSKKKKQ